MPSAKVLVKNEQDNLSNDKNFYEEFLKVWTIKILVIV